MSIKNFIALFVFIFSCSIFSREVIKVGAYEFKPYYIANDSKDIIRETIRLLNQIQNQYEFKLVPLPAKRRYEAIANNTVDLFFYEDLNWGWKDKKIHFHALPLNDGELFFSRSTTDKSIPDFTKLSGKSIAVMMGYHYKFTKFQSFEGVKFPFQLITAKDAEQVIGITINGRAHYGVLAHSYLKYSVKTKKHYKNTLTLSTFYDHRYQLGIIQGTKSKISLQQVELLKDLLVKTPQYTEVLKQLELNK